MLSISPTLAFEPIFITEGSTSVAQASELGRISVRNAMQGTAGISTQNTDARTASGWLSVRHPVDLLAGRSKSLGTELYASFEMVVRAASGWLSARPSQFFAPLWKHVCKSDKHVVTRSCVNACKGELTPSVSAHFSESKPTGHYHLPVFPKEVVDWMAPTSDKLIIDGTLGGGGHSELFLQAGSRVLGVDRDPEALSHASQRLAEFGGRFSTWEGNFSEVENSPMIQSGERADGLLLDLGVSSRQLDSAVRGFSFMRDGPLDMRMGPSSPRTAADVVNAWDEKDLVRILFEFGEEKRARRIASAIIQQREKKPFETTLELASCIEAAIGRRGRTHPATRAFQAIRMAVNEELDSLANALAAVPSILKPGGRLLIITFHSLEDRMVKRFLRHRSTAFLDDPSWPEPRPNPDLQFKLLARKVIVPSAEEIDANPRARSAKLRVGQLLEMES